MKIKIDTTLGGNSGIIYDPPILPDLDDLLELSLFTVSKTNASPCEQLTANWKIGPKTNTVNLSDFEFRLRVHYAELNGDIPVEGSQKFSVYKDTILSISARRRNSGSLWAPIGDIIRITIDSTGETKELPQFLFDSVAKFQIEQAINDLSYIRFRSEIVSTWYVHAIEYRLPLEVVIDNFFNGNLDITLRFAIRAELDDDGQSSLDISITSNENVNFSWWQDTLSLGHSETIAKTMERMLPIIMKFITRDAERQLFTAIYSYINSGNYLDDHRLMEINIVPSGNNGNIRFTFCNKTTGKNNFGISILDTNLGVARR